MSTYSVRWLFLIGVALSSRASALSHNAALRLSVPLFRRPTALLATPCRRPLDELCSRSLPARMFTEPPPPLPTGGPEDEWDEIIDQLTMTQRVLKNVGPLAMTTATNSITVLAAFLAWIITPTFSRVGMLLSVGAGGVAGGQLAKRLKDQRRAALPAVVAELIQVAWYRCCDRSSACLL